MKARNFNRMSVEDRKRYSRTKKPVTKFTFAPKPRVSYEEYLESPLWRYLRERVLDRDNHYCCCCKAKAVVVHHRDYTLATMEGRQLNRLVSLCMQCHDLVHINEHGLRNNVDEADLKLISLSKGKLPR